jgi:hypothetical protein
LNTKRPTSPWSIFRGFQLPLLTWGAVYFLFWCYRSLFSVLDELVIMRLTPVSDTRSYQSNDIITAIGIVGESGSVGTLGMQALATELTKAVGGVFGTLFFSNPILINIGFQSIGFLGMLAMLRALGPKERTIVLPILMLPSLSVWSSMASKEALLTFMVGIICAHIIDMYNNRDKLRWFHFGCIFLLYAFKPHYLAAIFFILSVTYAAKYCRQKATVAILALMGSFALLFLFRDQVSELANWVNFALTAMGGDSVRPGLLVEEYDVFYKAPYGMFLSFFGPTLGEITKILHIFTFIESSIIVGVFMVLLIRGLPYLPVYNIVVSFGTVFWIIFLNYPLGASNAGTAIRYRTGYILLVILAFAFLIPRSQYVNWTRGLPRKLAPLRRTLVRKGWIKEPPQIAQGTVPPN